MVLSKRERYVAIGAGIALGVLILNFAVVNPLLASADDLTTQINTQGKALDDAKKTITDNQDMVKHWSELTADGVMLSNDGDADLQLINAIGDCARDAGLSPQSEKREKGDKEKDFFFRQVHRCVFTGGLANVSRFLFDVQTLKIPARITDVQITTKREGFDELTLSVGISTINPLPPDPTKAQPAAAPQPEAH